MSEMVSGVVVFSSGFISAFFQYQGKVEGRCVKRAVAYGGEGRGDDGRY